MQPVTRHRSLWFDSWSLADPSKPGHEASRAAERLPLRRELAVDVCVVGAGITGVTAARLCKRAGMSVALLDAASIGAGETGHTTAHLATHQDLWFHDTIEKFGEDDARLILDSRRSAIAQIEAFVTDEGVRCGYERVPAYLFAEDAEGEASLRRELGACRRLGVDVQWVARVPAAFGVRGALRFPNQAQFHPLQYLRAVADRIEGNGSSVFEGTRVTSIEPGVPCVVHTEHGSVRCREVVLATHTPLNAMGMLITRVAPYRTYAVAFVVDPAAAPLALLWDTADPYHYVRQHRLGETTYLIAGGEDHRVGTSEDEETRFERIATWTRARFAVGAVAAQWSGQVLEPADGLPYIGRYDHHVWVATGYSGDGMTNGTLAGMLLTQLLLGEQSLLTKIYDPKRLDVLASIKEYVRENVDFPKHLVGDRLKPADTDRFRDVGRGQGMIVKAGREKLAVYRDPEGSVHAFSPVCTHMGCLVHWNEAESSWDCPCHGSRFDARTGTVLNGPATLALSAREPGRPSALPAERDSRVSSV